MSSSSRNLPTDRNQHVQPAEHGPHFVNAAREARAAMLESGLGFDANDVHAWLRERAAGRQAPRPQPKPWR